MARNINLWIKQAEGDSLDKFRRITIFAGHFGSGKTEVAINYILSLASRNRQRAIVDLDIVNPYFRSREVKALLEEQGVRVLASAEGFEGADIPALSPAILGVLQNPEYRVVLDVGGDNLGATALGRFRPNLPEGAYDFCLVVNPYRPFTRTPEAIRVMKEEIEAASRLRVTGLVSNPNLGMETSPELVVQGHRTVGEGADLMGLPVFFLAVKEELASAVAELLTAGNQGSEVPSPLFPLKIFMLPPWYENPENN